MKFVTISPYTTNIQIRKDVGMIPFLLRKEYLYDSVLATYKNEQEYDLKNVESLKISFIEKKYGEIIDVLLYIKNNYRDIDILNCYHYSYKSLIYLNYFNYLKKGKGVSYLKLDADDKILEHPKGFIKIKIYEYLFKKIGLATIETKYLYENLKDKFSNLVYLPNGFYNFTKSEENIDHQNVFLTVCVLDEARKSVFTIIEAFALFTRQNPGHSWKLKLVGSNGEAFKDQLNEYLNNNESIKDKVQLVGPIYDPVKLQDHYKAASVFILASLSESFGLVYVEALQYGCYILSTPLTPAKDITNNWEFGDFFAKKNSEELAKKMTEAATKDLSELRERAVKFAYDNFYWVTIIQNLNSEIKKVYLKNSTKN